MTDHAQLLPLEWPVWLVKRALRDDPPTELVSPSPMLRTFRRAGVTDLPPVVDRAIVDVDEAEDANMVGAVGPGFAYAESFDDEPTPVAAALDRLAIFLDKWDQLRRLRLTAADMDIVASTARALVEQDWPARVHKRALETAVVVIYARGYLPSSRGGAGQKWCPTDPAERELHKRLVEELRHPYHAHTGQSAHRTLVDTSAMVGVDGPPTFREQWSHLSVDELERIAALADGQRQRLTAAADELGEQLGEKRGPQEDGWNIS